MSLTPQQACLYRWVGKSLGFGKQLTTLIEIAEVASAWQSNPKMAEAPRSWFPPVQHPDQLDARAVSTLSAFPIGAHFAKSQNAVAKREEHATSKARSLIQGSAGQWRWFERDHDLTWIAKEQWTDCVSEGAKGSRRLSLLSRTTLPSKRQVNLKIFSILWWKIKNIPVYHDPNDPAQW